MYLSNTWKFKELSWCLLSHLNSSSFPAGFIWLFTLVQRKAAKFITFTGLVQFLSNYCFDVFSNGKNIQKMENTRREQHLKVLPWTPLSSFCHSSYSPQSVIGLLFPQDLSLKEWICYFSFSGKIKTRKSITGSHMWNRVLLSTFIAAIRLSFVLFFFSRYSICFKLEYTKK